MGTKHDDSSRPRSHGSQSAVLGQFSLTPATQTTVVTTTTTTTTAFPPFVMPSPRCLKQRDPETYPMAARPTPTHLRKLHFSFGGQSAIFEEAEEPTNHHSELLSPLDSNEPHTHNLKRHRQHETTKSSIPYAHSSHFRPASSSRQELEELDGLRRQSATPISISEASDDYTDPETNELDFNHPRRTRLGNAKLQPVPPPLVHSESPDRSKSDARTNKKLTHARENSPLPKQHRIHRTAAPAVATRASNPSLNPAGSATPPTGDTDTGYFDSTATAEPGRRTRSMLPNTIDPPPPAQDASLPSPSLSPITAAANLSRAAPIPASSDHTLSPDREIARSDSGTVIGLGLSTKDVNSAECEDGEEPCIATRPLTAPSINDIPFILDKFDTMPENLKSYVLYQLLRRSAKPTLHFVSESIAPALKCDFLRRLPLELSQHVLRYLDFQSMCRAAQVSKKWRHIVNSDEKAWKDLIDADGFVLPEGETLRAVEEGWGWQFPTGPTEWEKNLNPNIVENRRDTRSSTTSATLTSISAASRTPPASGKRKRSARISSSNKKQKRRTTRESARDTSGSPSLNDAQGPNAYASAALATVPDPKIGLRSLRSLHLFKSIYQRHHQIRKSWLDPNTKPKHIAFRAHERHVVTCLQFDSDKILTGSDDAVIDIYDTKTGAQLKRLSGHEGGVWALEYQGDILVSGSTDRSVRVWNMKTGKCLQVFQGHTSTVRCLQIVNPVRTGTAADGSPIMMPSEPLIITGSRDSSCRVWKLPKLDGRSIFQAATASVDFDNPYFVRSLTGHTHSVRAIAAYGDTLVSGSYDGTVRVWSIASGDTVHRLAGHTAKVYSVVLDHQRARCISGSMDNLVKVWSLESGENLFTLTGHHSLVGLLDLKDDYLVSAAADSTLKIWDPETGKIQHTLRAHTGAITCFAHDGRKVISGSDRTLKMWNTKTGECITDLLTDLNGVWQVRFDERRCIAAVNRNDWTFIEVLDFGAARDGIAEGDRGRRIVVNAKGEEVGEELGNPVDDDNNINDEDDMDEEDDDLDRVPTLNYPDSAAEAADDDD